MTKGVDERIHECILQRFGHVERMVNERYAKRVYVGECAGSRSVGRSRKRWIDTLKDCFRKRDLDVGQGRRMVQDKSEWRRFVKGECMGRSPRSELLTLSRCHSCGWVVTAI